MIAAECSFVGLIHLQACKDAEQSDLQSNFLANHAPLDEHRLRCTRCHLIEIFVAQHEEQWNSTAESSNLVQLYARKHTRHPYHLPTLHRDARLQERHQYLDA
nr:hypothetical protein [Planktothrix tepida]